MSNTEQKTQNAEKRIPVTDSVHARLSEHKGRLRVSFSELIEMALDALDREQEEDALDQQDAKIEF